MTTLGHPHAQPHPHGAGQPAPTGPSGPAGPAGPVTLADRLKAETADLHTRAERHDFQGGLLRGTLPISAFTAMQAQMFLVHTALELHLTVLRPRDPRLAQLVKDYHLRAPLLAQDLADLGLQTADIQPVAPTSAFIHAMTGHAEDNPLWFVGALYVLEGSTNGAKFILKALQRAYSRPGMEGFRYLDPHGEAQRERWQQFRADLAAMKLAPADEAAVVKAASETFQFIIDVMNALAGPAMPATGRPAHPHG